MGTEKCSNPFKKKKCGKTDIKLYIVVKGVTHPICESCWNEIADGKYRNKEW